ncbi:Cof-type HAD-IIB family hydrolase [Caldibacillus lycopersici]|uniref:Cof-type HAD-IIB family hydrolase n=1 Tax=Perspicuibacillus lycopersici TaxID=1325689 RepID=A0AAE3IRR4_9BACI|nr:Cof-type HAD-IIB family hydrolase [Perspicuibacillus lycopersici]MCU9612259.1 Cof-type HAD-IIB family hydrolase [Perspicuibacillus lycopersici]
MRKIVFLDIDGTILNTKHEIPAATKKAVQQLRENNIYVAIATGRAPFMFPKIREELAVDTYVSYNGQIVVVDNKTIHHFRFPVDMISSLLKMGEENGHPLVFMSNDGLKSSVEYDERIITSMQSLEFSHPQFQSNYYMNHPISQILLFCKEGEEERYEKAFPMCKFIRWHEYAVDVIPATGSKAEGIDKIINKLGFTINDTYAFGDGLNDIEMLTSVGTGIAMGNADPQVKKYANLVTSHVDEDGLYFGCKELGLI